MTDIPSPQPAHTPGPWTATVSEHGDDLRVESGSVTVVGGCGCCGSPYMEGPAKANARLIAAAPELLDMAECLRAVCARVIEQYGPVQCGVDFAALGGSVNRVIAKATGEES